MNAPQHGSVDQSSIRWVDGAIVTVDQRALPGETRELRLATVDQLVAAIGSLAIRGAPAIGLAGALGVALSAYHHRAGGTVDEDAVRADAARLASARPTAVNLPWAVQRALARLPEGPDAVLAEARAMLDEDAAVNRAAVARACDLVLSRVAARPMGLLTHCNTGRLATAAVGTALGVAIELGGRGLVREVLVDETRPLLQGSRLTAWELQRAGVAHRVCVDSAAAAAMARGLVDCVLVGADRIAANGDVANKIGTYGLAIAAARHDIPFVVVAPESTWDRRLADGSGIVIEERDPAEVTACAGTPTSPPGSAAYNPAFDVTPAELITAIVSEKRAFIPGTKASRCGGRLGPSEPGTSTTPHAAPGAGTTPHAPPGAGTRAQAAPPRGGVGQEVALFARRLYERGWMPGTAGNLSVRQPDGTVLITASGRPKGELTEGDMVAVDAETGTASRPGPLRASAETTIHCAVYRTTDAQAVIHVHAPYATAVAARLGHPSQPRSLPVQRFELLKGLGLADPSHAVLPIFPNWPEVPRIAADVAEHLAATPQAPPALLITDHGITTWGRDLAQARDRLECLESICQLLLLTQSAPTAAHDEGR